MSEKEHFQNQNENNKIIHEISSDPQINNLLNDVVKRLKDHIEQQTNRLNELTKIGVALSAARNLDKLLEDIVNNARSFTNADGGTLYLRNEDETALEFTIVQTESLNIRMGGVSGGPVTLPEVPLNVADKPNNNNVSAYVANTGKLVNIPDAYEVEGFDFSGTRKFDAAMNYRSMSMLVVPMRDHEGEIMGVLQLINARDPETGEKIPFAPEFEMLTEALASQAAVAITNTRLLKEITELFESFIRTIASAIDKKSHYTGGHIERVSNLTMDVAKRINQAEEGYYADTRFTEDELTELRLAAWLHDTGKITTPEYVVDKRTKLETIFDRKEMVRLRFELAVANEKLKACKQGAHESGNGNKAEVIQNMEKRIQELHDDMDFIYNSNMSSEFVPDEKIERFNRIAQVRIPTTKGEEHLLSDDELYNLSIRKGNLTAEERTVIENHVVMTYLLLNELPFPRKMKNVPFIAGAHHEKLNGKGYPNELTADQIPLQVRIMTLADVFEALTARDRPYVAPRKLSQAVKILGFMVKDEELDGNLVDFFLSEGMHIEYAKEYMDPDQVDIE